MLYVKRVFNDRVVIVSTRPIAHMQPHDLVSGDTKTEMMAIGLHNGVGVRLNPNMWWSEDEVMALLNA